MCKELNDPNIFLFLSAYGFSFFSFIFPLIKEFQSPITREAFPVSSRVYKHIGMHSHVLEVTSSDKQKKMFVVREEAFRFAVTRVKRGSEWSRRSYRWSCGFY